MKSSDYSLFADRRSGYSADEGSCRRQRERGWFQMSTTQELERTLGQDVYDVEGHKVGTASHLYASDVSGAPEWVTVKTGLFGGKESFVPLTGAHAERDGLHVGAHKDLIKEAPRIDDNGHLS